MSQTSLLELRGVGRRMNSEFFLQDISFCLHAGETLALAGKNASGKSALLGVLGGHYPAREGEILRDGQTLRIDSPEAAMASGIVRLGEGQPVFENLSVLDNLFFGCEPKRLGALGVLDHKQMRTTATRLFEQMGARINLSASYEILNDAERQIVGLARASVSGARVLLLDQATAHLRTGERDAFWQGVRAFLQQGCCAIMVSHDPEEVLAHADQVLVLHEGRQQQLSPAAQFEYATLCEAAYGISPRQLYARELAEIGGEVLRADHLTSEWLQDVSFSLRAGEITALLGGTDARMLARTLAGLDKSGGTVTVAGQVLTPGSPLSAAGLGISLAMTAAEEEEVEQAQQLLDEGTRDNAAGRMLLKIRSVGGGMSKMFGGWLLPHRDEPEQSGLQRQGALIKRALRRRAKVYVLVCPCVGLDLPARLSVYEMLGDLARDGAAILLVPGSVDEAFGLADRMLGLAHGSVMFDAPTADVSRETASGLMG